jgi:hypothetical protein
VDSYRRVYSAGIQQDGKTTLAAVDLSQVVALAAGITELSNALDAKMPTEAGNIKAARGSVQGYAQERGGNYLDITQVMLELEKHCGDQHVRSLASHVRDLVRAAVFANYAGSARQGAFGSHGLAIYFPATRNDYENDDLANHEYERNLATFPVKFIDETAWRGFLETYWTSIQ